MVLPDGLFGGGCVVQNDKLIISGAFLKSGGKPKLSTKSYFIDLQYPINLPPDGRLAWQETQRPHRIPGHFRRMVPFYKIVYILGGSFKVKRELYRRDFALEEDFDPLGSPGIEDEMSFAKEGEKLTEPGLLYPSAEDYLYVLNEGLYIACVYKGVYYVLRNKEGDDSPLTNIVKESHYGGFSVPTKNQPPPFSLGYSVAQRQNMVYVATDNYIYTLDLDTLTWENHRVPGFKAYRSGCLNLHKTTLIHAFGSRDGQYINSTQFIDTTTWKLQSNYYPVDPTKQKPDSVPRPTKNYNIVIYSGILLFIIGLVLILGIIFLIRRRRKEPELGPPEFYTEAIWVDHSSISKDLSHLDINTDSEIIDSTLHEELISFNQSGPVTRSKS